MNRVIIFTVGLAIAMIAWPQVQSHHLRNELLQLAWCSSSGQAPGTQSFFGMHCVWCPVFVTGIAVMIVSPFLQHARTMVTRLAQIMP
tara:strand:- start:93 stop:356 length:264 start_codon:yes stop_codon:yes gene_type:complete